MNEIQQHFDILAKEYERGKKRNWYYYKAVKDIYKELIPPHSRVLEIGCGIGDILESVSPVQGTGIDISGEMIKKAKERYASRPELKFYQSDISVFLSPETFDFIFLADVIEHLTDIQKSFESIGKMLSKDTMLIISMANPIWEVVLMVAEKLNLKMPEGPHKRLSIAQLLDTCQHNNLELVTFQYRLPFPKHVPFFSDFFNAAVEKIPVLKKVGVIVVFVFKKKV